MKGYLIQLRADYVEELYWSKELIDLDLFKKAYHEWEDSDWVEDDFEEWWNQGTSEIKIERVFVDEINV